MKGPTVDATKKVRFQIISKVGSLMLKFCKRVKFSFLTLSDGTITERNPFRRALYVVGDATWCDRVNLQGGSQIEFFH